METAVANATAALTYCRHTAKSRITYCH